MYHIMGIGSDRWNAVQLITDLEGDGFTVVPIGMEFKDMGPGMKDHSCRQSRISMDGWKCSGMRSMPQRISNQAGKSPQKRSTVSLL